MDFCGGQNKDNIILGYFLLRVILGVHQKVLLKLMTVWHTKSGPDRMFEMIEQQMKREVALTVEKFRKTLSTMLFGA